MAGKDVPDAVAKLLREHVRGFEQLELLLLAARDPARRWTAQSIATELRIDSAVTERALDELTESGILARSPSGEVVYAPGSPALDQAVRELARCHTEDRLAVMELMCANALERLRSMTLRTFADAFRLRGPKDDG